MAGSSDSEEVRRRRRDEEFSAFRRQTEPAMRTIARGRLSSRKKSTADPQVAVDKAYEQLYGKWDDVPDEERYPLLITIVTRRAIDLARRQKLADDLPQDDRRETFGEVDDAITAVDDEAEDRWNVRRINDVLARIEPREREVIERVIRDGEPAADVAADWKVTETRVNQVKRKALARVQRLLGVPQPDIAQRAAGDDDDKGT